LEACRSCDVKVPTLSRQYGSQMAVRLSALRAGHPLSSWRFLIPAKSWVDSRAMLRLEGLHQLKKCSDLIRNRTRDLGSNPLLTLPCRSMGQPTTEGHPAISIGSTILFSWLFNDAGNTSTTKRWLTGLFLKVDLSVKTRCQGILKYSDNSCPSAT
jgi:hypothetical protein